MLRLVEMFPEIEPMRISEELVLGAFSCIQSDIISEDLFF